MEGWIKLHRKFTEWEWFNISEMVHLFIFLLLNANHEDNFWQGNLVKRGQYLTGINSLSNKTKISIQTLRTCLKRLEKTREINIQSTNKFSIITICNYDSYQNDKNTTNKQANKQLTNNQQATNKQLTTNKNDNNEKNENNDKNILLKNITSEFFNTEKEKEYFEITISFLELFKKNKQEKGASISDLEKANLKWVNATRLLIEKDKYKTDDLRQVFKFLQKDEFWKSNVYSMVTLREKFDKILIKARSNNTSFKNNNDDMAEYRQQLLIRLQNGKQTSN